MAATAEQHLRELSAIIRKTAEDLAPLQEKGGLEETLKGSQQSETIRVCVSEALLYHHNKKLRAS